MVQKNTQSLQNFPVEQQRPIGGSLDGIFNAYGSIQLHMKSFWIEKMHFPRVGLAFWYMFRLYYTATCLFSSLVYLLVFLRLL